MKAIIYAGISLFSVAAVYGVTDYYNTNKKDVVDKMYKDEAAIEPKNELITATVTPVEKNEAVESKTATTATTTKKTINKKKKLVKRLKFSDFSRGRIIEEPEIVKPVVVPVKPAAN